MVPGMPNSYAVTPLVKMVITTLKLNKKDLMKSSVDKTFSVLYNPQSYRMTRSTGPKPEEGGGGGRRRRGRPVQQFSKSATMETLSVDLFLDTFSAGLEVVGIDAERKHVDTPLALSGLKFTGNCELPSYGKQIDVRDYANLLYDLCLPDADSHHPPAVKLTWNSLEFYGFMQSCTVEYVKFKETGMPVRAIAHCTFISGLTVLEMMGGSAFNSPDTSKFHTVQEGETLNALSDIAYDDPTHWREIASANGITNPRLLRTGDVLRMPALVD